MRYNEYIQWIFLSLTKEDADIRDDMDEPRANYAKWNNSDTERKILNDLTCMWTLEQKLNTQKQTGEWWFPQLGQEGNGK
jgi:hypothetical protein